MNFSTPVNRHVHCRVRNRPPSPQWTALWRTNPVLTFTQFSLSSLLVLPSYWNCDQVSKFSFPLGLLTAFFLIISPQWRAYYDPRPQCTTVMKINNSLYLLCAYIY
jgi:hypothetical protein